MTSCAEIIEEVDYGHDTIVMKINQVSKSRFKAHALELFRQVEASGHPIVITDRGIPVLKLSPYKEDPDAMLEELRGTVVELEKPFEPVGLEDWETL
jgi:antitoxin (DNA-binding transcriptional repressor) of toxin-antitoxin stability system